MPILALLASAFSELLSVRTHVGGSRDAGFSDLRLIKTGINYHPPHTPFVSRVFDKIKGRNAHMKRHRPQHRAVPLLQAQWALGPLKREEAAAGGALSSSWGAEPPE